MIVSQILHTTLSPNSLSMVIVTLNNSQQVEFAAECFDWGLVALLEFLPIIHSFIGINSLSEQQLELFVYMTNSEIIEDRVNLQLLMTCTSALPTHSMSDTVFTDVGEFCFASAPFIHCPIHPNQITKE